MTVPVAPPTPPEIPAGFLPPSRSRGGLDIVVIRLLTPLFLCVIICSREAVE